MAVGFPRKPLGVMLGNSILPGDQPEVGMGDFGAPGQGMGAKPKGGFFREGGMGRTIAGLIGDTLLQQADLAPVYAPSMRQQQAMKAEEAQWTRRRADERADKQWEWANKPKDDAIPPILRDAMAWQTMTEDQRKAYQAMQEAQRGPITMLPNGMAYVRDPALAAQIGMPAATGAPAAPVGKLTPIAGGPTPTASGPFRP